MKSWDNFHITISRSKGAQGVWVEPKRHKQESLKVKSANMHDEKEINEQEIDLQAVVKTRNVSAIVSSFHREFMSDNNTGRREASLI